MLKNYFIVALRSFRRNKIFSLINIVGLSIGLSAALVIYLIVHYDFSFDKFHNDGNRIYRVVSNLHFPGQLIQNSGVPYPLPDAAKNELTGIASSAAFCTYADTKVTVPGAVAEAPAVYKHQANIIFADENYFNLFSYQWLAGSPKSSLHEPFQVVLTESRVKTYFPGRDITKAIGQTIRYNDSVKATISGVVKDLEETTDFTFKEFISRSTIPNSGLKDNMGWNDWTGINSNSQFFVRLAKNSAPSQIEKELAILHNKYAKEDFMKTEHLLQPLGEIHFFSEYDNFDQRQAHKPVLYGLLAVAAFLLLLGCINFINLTTAQATQRAREIGIRKTLGSSKGQLVFQFLSETFLLTLMATVLSVLITPWILKVFADFIPAGLHFNLLQQSHIIWFLVVLVIIVTILSGFYPALVLSGFQPVDVLKNQAYTGSGKTRNAWLRKSLTVLQFMIAQFFILATLVVSKQIHYSLNKDMGFRKEAIINLSAPWNDEKHDNRFVLLNKIRAVPEVEMVSLGGSPPATTGYSSTTMKFKDGKKEIESTVEVKSADSTYFNLYKLKLLAGKFPQPSDTAVNGYLINQSYANFLGFKNPQGAVGRLIERGSRHTIPIAGVFADFHFKSLHSAIKPLVYESVSNSYYTYHILLKSNGEDRSAWKNGIAKIESAWKEVYPGYDFSYHFFDESIASFYKSEQDISQLLKWATGLVVFISCLGLLGLVIYTTNLRTKEIGVRKILGASLSQIVTLLSKDFLMLVLFAFLIAAPLAWWAMHKWLEDFAYKTTISWWLFLLCGVSILLIALVTLGIQTVRAAMSNPVKSLRSE